jgi:amylosucrase
MRGGIDDPIINWQDQRCEVPLARYGNRTTDWGKVARREEPGTLEHQIYSQLSHLVRLHKACPALAGGEMELVDSGNSSVFSFVRHNRGDRILVVANFSEHEQVVEANQLRIYGLSYTFSDLVSDKAFASDEDLRLAPYQFIWLRAVTDV